MKYYIVAGERSGDLHAGNLVKAIRALDPESSFRGFGGDYMSGEGVQLAVHYRDLAFMGFAELLTNAFKIRKYIRRCREDIVAFSPDVVILIDYGGFNLQVARFAKENGYKVYFYILPKYWAWWPRRVWWLKPHVDEVFSILPFEKEFLQKFAWDAHYVGNPVLDAVKDHPPDDNFPHRNGLQNKPYVALLPGSRKQELAYVIPVMEGVVRAMPDQHFCVAAVSNLDRKLYGALGSQPNVTFVLEDTYNLLKYARAAVVTSGTATLETALFRVPQVVVYRANPVSYWFARAVVTVKFISLVNLIAGKEVVKELIQSDATAAKTEAEVRLLLEEGPYRSGMLDEYAGIIRRLDTGSASGNAAALMLQLLNKPKVLSRNV